MHDATLCEILFHTTVLFAIVEMKVIVKEKRVRKNGNVKIRCACLRNDGDEL